MINESLVAKQGTLATIETPPQMLVGKLRHFTPTGGTFQETLFYQERFIDFLYRAGIFAQSGGNGGQSHRAAFELVNDGAEYLIIYLIQTVFVDIQGFEGKLCNFRIDIPEPFTWAKSRTRRSNALAIRGVPRLRLAISAAALTEQGTSRMPDERRIMPLNTSSS